MLRRTLDAMADGGIHDHVGGGFARYSTDAMWHVPHFEKMLYDNAQLLELYSRAFVITRNDRYREVALGIARWMLREMQQPDGGFSSSQDADSDGVEGAFFVWSWDELVSVVGEFVATALGATRDGNWEGANVLWVPRPVADVAAELGMSDADLQRDVERGLTALFERREHRTRPGTDDKVVAAWNGLAIAGLAIAGAALSDPSLLEAAECCATFVWDRLRDDSGRLLRSWREGTARVRGFSDDHALVGLGFCALYERTGETRWLLRARELSDTLIERFASDDGGFYQTGDDAEALVVRKLDLLDEPTPSGDSGAAELLLRLGHYAGDAALEDRAVSALGQVADVAGRAPTAAGHALRTLELFAGPTAEVAIVGEATGDARQHLVDAVVGSEHYSPNAIVAVADPSDLDAKEIPLFEGRLDVATPTAFVCQRFVCRLPVTTPEELGSELAATIGS
jgi:uncharacterized protein